MTRFHYVRYCTLSEVRDYWRNKAGGGRTVGQKVVAVHGSPCASTPLILITLDPCRSVALTHEHKFGLT
jgi:hypothetical protein